MVKNWEDINWKNSSLVIHDLQRKIFDASAKEKGLRGLLVSQEYKCAKCQFYLLPNDIVELHHVLDNNKVRTGEIKLVHGHCHDLIHGNNLHSSSVDNGQEPCELRGSCTVRE